MLEVPGAIAAISALYLILHNLRKHKTCTVQTIGEIVEIV